MSKVPFTASVVSLRKVTPESTQASVRIAKFIADTLKLPILDSAETLRSAPKGQDVLIFVNGATAFCDFLEEMIPHILTAKRIIWCVNDYTIIPPTDCGWGESPFRKAFRDRKDLGLPHWTYWSTCDKYAERGVNSSYINWNKLTYEPLPEEHRSYSRSHVAGHALYYGAWRDERKEVFEKYITPCGTLPLTVSSASPRMKKFCAGLEHVQFVDGVDRSAFYELLAAHAFGLYLEDPKSSVQYHSPSNRFYEMLSAGLPIAFPESAVKMFKDRSGIDVSKYVVRGPEDYKEFAKNRKRIGKAQAKWGADFRGQLTADLKTLWRGYVGK